MLRNDNLDVDKCVGLVRKIARWLKGFRRTRVPEKEGNLMASLIEVIEKAFVKLRRKWVSRDVFERNGGQVTATELNASYDKELEGAALDPDTLVDPKTLEPVESAE